MAKQRDFYQFYWTHHGFFSFVCNSTKWYHGSFGPNSRCWADCPVWFWVFHFGCRSARRPMRVIAAMLPAILMLSMLWLWLIPFDRRSARHFLRPMNFHSNDHSFCFSSNFLGCTSQKKNRIQSTYLQNNRQTRYEICVCVVRMNWAFVCGYGRSW